VSHVAYPIAAAFTTALGIASTLASFVPDEDLGAITRLIIAGACGIAMCTYLIKRRRDKGLI
jgi:hypothetical protein